MVLRNGPSNAKLRQASSPRGLVRRAASKALDWLEFKQVGGGRRGLPVTGLRAWRGALLCMGYVFNIPMEITLWM